MRESNYTFPPSNRAIISINQMLYDRRALDTNSTLALLNNLCQLTYLTSTSPRIREVLTLDGGLERMLDILRESTLPHEPTMPDLWGLNGPCTARTINVDRAISLRHSLAFQCVVNIGVRGNETIRTRVVQAGALDIVAQILESWLKKNGIAVFSSSVGSQAAYDILAAGGPLTNFARRRQGQSRQAREHVQILQSQAAAAQHDIPATLRVNAATAAAMAGTMPVPQQPEAHPGFGGRLATRGAPASPPLSAPAAVPTTNPPIATPTPVPATRSPLPAPAPARGFVQSITNRLNRSAGTSPTTVQRPERPQTVSSGMDTDVDMADAETEGGETDTNDTDNGGDGSMEIEYLDGENGGGAATTTTPRARMALLPLQIPHRSPDGQPQPSTSTGASSTGESVSGDEPPIPRARSDVSLNLTNQANIAPGRPRSGFANRAPQVAAADAASTQSSPVGSPVHIVEHIEGSRGRRGTVVGRPLLLAPREQRRQDESEASDGGTETDLAQATISAGIAAAAANAAFEAATAVPNQPRNGPQPEIVDGDEQGMAPEEPDPEILAAEQARFDMEAGAPPGQPGATPQVNTTEVPLPPAAADLQMPAATMPPAQIIIANGAPRGFQDLASYVGVSMLLNPDGANYSEDNILLALQLLAYLSKYPHVRVAFHHPRRPMHKTFELDDPEGLLELPERPAVSETPNLFSLVERFTFRPSPTDPHMYRVPNEIQYWAGVIMRNACRKDDARHGIRQCAHMSCGRWEVYAREFAKCRRCRKAKYCSKDCQSKAWSEGHRFWCSIRSESEPNADGGPGGGSRRGGGGGGDAPSREDDEDDEDMNGGGGPGGAAGGGGGGGGGGGEAATQATPRARADHDMLVDADVPEGIEQASGQSTPRAASPAASVSGATTPRPPSGATTPIFRPRAHADAHTPQAATAPASSGWAPGSTPPLPPTTTPPPAPTLSTATPVLPSGAAGPSYPQAHEHSHAHEHAHSHHSHAHSGFSLPAFLKRGGGAGPSSTYEMNSAMGR